MSCSYMLYNLCNFCILMFLSRISAELLFLFFSVVLPNVQLSFTSFSNLYFLLAYLTFLKEKNKIKKVPSVSFDIRFQVFLLLFIIAFILLVFLWCLIYKCLNLTNIHYSKQISS